MTQYGFYFDSARCTGCKTCVLACKDFNNLDTSLLFRKVYDIEGGDWTQDDKGAWVTNGYVYHVSLACNHCDAPACVAVCPSGAATKSEETGFVTSDSEVCIGCGSCTTACPYDAPKLDRERSVSVKCDGCASRVGEGLAPICVEACPLRALEFGEIEALRSTYGDVADVYPLPPSSDTGPNLVLGQPDVASGLMTAGKVANDSELV